MIDAITLGNFKTAYELGVDVLLHGILLKNIVDGKHLIRHKQDNVINVCMYNDLAETDCN